MNFNSPHSFHIPVMGLGYTIDTPVKVARFGISSVVSIIQDDLVEQMRKFYCEAEGLKYTAISTKDIDHRAKRIRAYLNLLKQIVDAQVQKLKAEAFGKGKDIDKYFRLLPDSSPDKHLYTEMNALGEGPEKEALQQKLRQRIIPGAIDVNIMTKVDNPSYDKAGKPLPDEYSDALSALRGFALSELSSAVVFSAGLNPRLFAYLEKFSDFYPDENGNIKKKIILKVSDYRSALIQGKFLAKKGIYISEFRIESGLNCGGHAFPTEGHLLGPILEEFRTKREELSHELFPLLEKALADKKLPFPSAAGGIRVSVQGGIGTAEEDAFLREYYKVHSTGWGSPFLLVPEATNVDQHTLEMLATAQEEDYYLSHSSPLGLPFNNFRKSSAEEQRKERIMKHRPGSPCYKKHLAFNTEFTPQPICTASRQYQNLKIRQLTEQQIPGAEFQEEFDLITEKDCLCEGLSVAVLLKNRLPVEHHLEAVTICPGPNLAYFSGIFSLEDMVAHIYGRKNILNARNRPHMFLKELKMYVDFFKTEAEKCRATITAKQKSYLSAFRSNLDKGIAYYQSMLLQLAFGKREVALRINADLEDSARVLANVVL
ncbi:MAG: hypothetical protein AB1458_01930 [Bacteroidota bacterium]